MQGEPPPSQPQPATEPVESRGTRLRRHGHRTRLYAWAFSPVALLAVVIALAAANTRQLKLSWKTTLVAIPRTRTHREGLVVMFRRHG